MEFDQYLDNTRSQIVEHVNKVFKHPSNSPLYAIFKEKIEYHNHSLGKLLRPTLVVATSDALGGSHEEALYLGGTLELIHDGSLVHDDIIDNDETRRGEPTIWKQFGNRSAVLLGDIFYVCACKSTRTLSELHRNDAFDEVIEAFGRVSAGAEKENFRNHWNENDYIGIVRLKTAALFRAATRFGCIAADATEETRDLLSNFGELVGTAFQMEDDIGDITKSMKEDVPFGDLREGKVTLPMIYLYSKYPELHDELNEFTHGIEDMRTIKHTLTHIDEAVQYTRHVITQLLVEANSHIGFIPFQNGGRQLLEQYGKYAIDSMRKEI